MASYYPPNYMDNNQFIPIFNSSNFIEPNTITNNTKVSKLDKRYLKKISDDDNNGNALTLGSLKFKLNNWSIGSTISDTGLNFYSNLNKALSISQNGNVGIGINGSNQNSQLYVGNNSNCDYIMQIGGVLGNSQYAFSTAGLIMRPAFVITPGVSNNINTFQFVPTISLASSATYPFGYSVRADAYRDLAGYGTLTNWASFYSDGGGMLTNGSGPGTTITNAYSLYLNKPIIGTNNYCAYLNGNVGINNLTPTYSLDVNGVGRLSTSDGSPQLLLLQTTNSAYGIQVQYKNTALANSEIWTQGISISGNKSFYLISPSDTSKTSLCLSSNGCTIGDNNRANDGSMLSVFHNNYTVGSSFIHFWGAYSSSSSNTVGLDISTNSITTNGYNNDHVLITPNLYNNCNIGTNYGLHIISGSMGAGGSCATAYGLYVDTPAFGTNKYCAVFTGGIGVNTNTPNKSSYGIDVANQNCRQSSSTTWATGSDQRIKLNIETANYDICYDNMKNIELRRFEWDSEYMPDVNDKKVIGFIAQEVESFYPKAIIKSEENGFEDFRSLDVDQIYKCMYGCVKKLINDKEALEATVASQQQQINTLQSQMNALLAKLNITL